MITEQRTETEILDQIRQIDDRMYDLLFVLPQTKANSAEQRSLLERKKEIWQEHYAFYGNW